MAVLTRRETEKKNKQIIALLEDLGGGAQFNEESDIDRQGDKLVMPEKWTWDDLIVLGQRKKREEAETDNWVKQYSYRPWDGAWCLQNVLKRVFGEFHVSGKMGWFGPNPPRMITVNSGVNETVEVPWGDFSLPLFDEVSFECDTWSNSERGTMFQLTAYGPKRLARRIKGIFTMLEEELRTNSLYRGKAFDGQEDPDFIDVWAFDAAKVVYSEQVTDQLEEDIWAVIRHPEAHLRAGMAIKRSALLYGPWGTGKTLAGMLTAQVAVNEGWTFIQARPGRDDIHYVFQTALLLEPCVVFIEDVDGVMTDTDRMSIARLLDDFDGISAKGSKLLCVMTTNYPENIQGGMARPGRIDSFIEITSLDLAGVRRLVETRVGDNLDPEGIDWEQVFEAMEGYLPAFVTEAADRTVRRLIRFYGGAYTEHIVTTGDLVARARGMRSQYNIMLGSKGLPVPESLDVALRRNVGEVIEERLNPNVLSNHS